LVEQMLADPRHSRLVLINHARKERDAVSLRLVARRKESLCLLPAAFEVLGVGLHAIGDYD
jgi:hypothetical protein